MKVILSNPRVLGDGSAAGSKHYPKGQHEISDAVANHWFTAAMLDSGDITVMAEPKAKPEKSAASKGPDSQKKSS